MRRLWFCVLLLVPAGELRAGGITFSNGKSSMTFAELMAAAPVSVGLVEFTNFTSNFPAPITVDNVIATAVFNSTGFGIQFTFNPALNSPAVGNNNLSIGYDASASSLVTASASFDGMRMGIGSEASLGETAGQVNLSLSAANGPMMETKSFAPGTKMVSVTDSASASLLMNNGASASISMFVNTFSVPEPSSWIMLASAVVTFVGWRAKVSIRG